MEQMPAASAVAATADSNGTPAAARMPGLANRMYAIVRNVARAPPSSRATVVRRASSVNSRSTSCVIAQSIPHAWCALY